MRLHGLFLVAAVGGTAAADSETALTGAATFSNGDVVDQPADLELDLAGTAEIRDGCADVDERRFVASYRGRLVPTQGGDRLTFVAMLTPTTPTIETPSGCEVHELDGIEVTEATVRAWTDPTVAACTAVCRDAACLASCAKSDAIRGRGTVNLAPFVRADVDDLETGAFGALWTTIVFADPTDTAAAAIVWTVRERSPAPRIDSARASQRRARR